MAFGLVPLTESGEDGCYVRFHLRGNRALDRRLGRGNRRAGDPSCFVRRSGACRVPRHEHQLAVPDEPMRRQHPLVLLAPASCLGVVRGLERDGEQPAQHLLGVFTVGVCAVGPFGDQARLLELTARRVNRAEYVQPAWQLAVGVRRALQQRLGRREIRAAGLL